jgi:hypothetical protein
MTLFFVPRAFPFSLCRVVPRAALGYFSKTTRLLSALRTVTHGFVRTAGGDLNVGLLQVRASMSSIEKEQPKLVLASVVKINA